MIAKADKVSVAPVVKSRESISGAPSDNRWRLNNPGLLISPLPTYFIVEIKVIAPALLLHARTRTLDLSSESVSLKSEVMDNELISSKASLRQTSALSETFPLHPRKSAKLYNATTTRSSPQTQTAAVDANLRPNVTSMPKQSKSRSGCMTCKKKRIKCDEAKPTCGQCEKRKVECDGYKLHYKWRSFDDTTKPPPGSAKAPKKQTTTSQENVSVSKFVQQFTPPISSYLEEELSWSPEQPSVCTQAAPAASECLRQSDEDDLTPSPEQLSPSQIDFLSDLESGFRDSDVELMSDLPIASSRSSGSNDKVFNDEIVRDWAVSLSSEADGPLFRAGASSPTNFQSSVDSILSNHVTPFHGVHLDHSAPEMLLLRFDNETCGILSIKDSFAENPWRNFIRPLAKNSEALYHAVLAMAALHGAATQPRLRLIGMAHMTKSISKLSAEMHNMSWHQILASALALCLGEGWDDKISTGINHLKGARTALSNALARRSKSVKLGQLGREEAEQLRFLSNTFVYLDAIARLTSSEDDDNIDLDNIIQAVNDPVHGEIDPLMGCATTLFPLLGKVASLIQRIRRTSANSLNIIGEANALREQLLHWEPPDLYSFEQPRDPSSNVRHVLQTAEAYRRAILLHLHSAVTELSSEPSYNQAKGTLAMLAATPLSSRTMIVQIFPLFVGSCEMVQPDDRQWVAQRWEAMMKRLTLVSVSSCWKIVKEVWRRRDQWLETQAQQMRPRIGRSMSSGPFTAKTKNRNIIEASLTLGDALDVNSLDIDFEEKDESTHNCFVDFRRKNLTADAACNLATRRDFVQLPRNHTDVSLLSGAVEYTVRGQLHWLGVMSDWNWEVFL